MEFIEKFAKDKNRQCVEENIFCCKNVSQNQSVKFDN